MNLLKKHFYENMYIREFLILEKDRSLRQKVISRCVCDIFVDWSTNEINET